jgi:homoserine kinase
MTESIRVFAPATVANLGPGFDILGMAVTEPGDTVTARRTDKAGVVISHIGGDGGQLSINPTQNTAGIAAEYVRQLVDSSAGIELEIEKGLPLASGLGSSAASAVAAAVAVNTLLGNTLEKIDLLPALLEAEAAVSGRHADNVAPSLLGGIVLITGTSAGDLHQLPVSENIFTNLHIALVTPNVAVATADARAVLPETVPFATMVSQTKAAAQLIHAVHMDDIKLLAQAMMQDQVIEPAREHLIPHFVAARNMALNQGALAAIISGAGPTICVLTESHSEAEQIGNEVREAYEIEGVGATCRIVRPSARGAYVVS